MVVLVTAKNDENPIKNEGPRVLTTLSIFQTLKGIRNGIWSKLELIRDIVVVLVTCKYEKNSDCRPIPPFKIKNSVI